MQEVAVFVVVVQTAEQRLKSGAGQATTHLLRGGGTGDQVLFQEEQIDHGGSSYGNEFAGLLLYLMTGGQVEGVTFRLEVVIHIVLPNGTQDVLIGIVGNTTGTISVAMARI